jgi:hypothetical protein
MEESNVKFFDDPPAFFDTSAGPVKHKDKKPALLIEYMEVRAGLGDGTQD